jgi:hypothetical protein
MIGFQLNSDNVMELIGDYRNTFVVGNPGIAAWNQRAAHDDPGTCRVKRPQIRLDLKQTDPGQLFVRRIIGFMSNKNRSINGSIIIRGILVRRIRLDLNQTKSDVSQ